MTEKLSIPRSKFLQLSFKLALGLAGMIGLGGLVRFFSHELAGNTPSSFDLGFSGDFPASGKLVRLDIPAIIYQTKDGFQAFSLVCTHLGCTVEEDGENFSCPCHGSQFDHAGKVLKGPAAEGLPTFSVTADEDGHLILNTRGEGK